MDEDTFLRAIQRKPRRLEINNDRDALHCPHDQMYHFYKKVFDIEDTPNQQSLRKDGKVISSFSTRSKRAIMIELALELCKPSQFFTKHMDYGKDIDGMRKYFASCTKSQLKANLELMEDSLTQHDRWYSRNAFPQKWFSFDTQHTDDDFATFGEIEQNVDLFDETKRPVIMYCLRYFEHQYVIELQSFK
jgi:hypothetical protein